MIDFLAIQAALSHERPPVVCPLAQETEALLRHPSSNTYSILLNWREMLKNRVNILANKCSVEDWDGEGSLPVTNDAINAAKNFIDLLPEGVKEPFITAENTGDLAFDWDIGKDMTFAVIVSGDSAFYAGIFGGSSRRGSERICNELPRSIKDVLLTYFGK